MQNQTQTQIDIVGDVLATIRATLGPEFFPCEMERAVEAKIRFKWGGQEVYVKKIDVEARDKAIRARYNMCNRRELMAEFGVARTHFYRILKGG